MFENIYVCVFVGVRMRVWEHICATTNMRSEEEDTG